MDPFEDRKRKILNPLYVEAGAALFDCQGFEFGLGLLLFHFARLGASGLDPARLEAILENDEKKTAGQLMNLLRQKLRVSKEMEELCADAIAARNKLIHRMLIDNAERLVDDVTRREVIKEIRDLRSTVQRADKMIRPFIEALSEAIDGEDSRKIRLEAKDRFLGTSQELDSAS